LFNNWSYGSLETKAPAVLLAVAIGFWGSTLLIYLHSLIKKSTLRPGVSLALLRYTYLLNMIAAALLTSSAAQISTLSYNIASSPPTDLPVRLDALYVKGFYFPWMSASFAWSAAGTAISLSVVNGGIFSFLCRPNRKSDREETFSDLAQPPKELKEVS
jgi:hypothetical protein